MSGLTDSLEVIFPVAKLVTVVTTLPVSVFDCVLISTFEFGSVIVLVIELVAGFVTSYD